MVLRRTIAVPLKPEADFQEISSDQLQVNGNSASFENPYPFGQN